MQSTHALHATTITAQNHPFFTPTTEWFSVIARDPEGVFADYQLGQYTSGPAALDYADDRRVTVREGLDVLVIRHPDDMVVTALPGRPKTQESPWPAR